MKINKELREISETKLQEKLGEFKKELLKMNVQVMSGASIANPGRLRQTKKNIARIKTVLRKGEVSK